ncbi:AlpA family phage regulatory protein [Vibrio parahaemolyticus]|uniref:AlpA family phage regulatory protein n=2 Tax=Vibrionaceae TaxID=641 RepID=UPI0019D4350F|nr:AlpA family phage regulatory protein [Vibrio vulnificus]EGU9030575.1 AlpA family phage regulatory protein [Vibrio parahaemolyticus]EIO4608175.1 AlpA family phage regulatory protein [Vibrio parahaemolyticus]MBN8034438.1 AlpA family phage regulatory protein [Vibrio vulnificus]
MMSIQQSKPQLQDRVIREAERQLITSISRSQAYQLEKQGRFPKRITLGSRSVGWRLSEIMAWVDQRTMGV